MMLHLQNCLSLRFTKRLWMKKPVYTEKARRMYMVYIRTKLIFGRIVQAEI